MQNNSGHGSEFHYSSLVQTVNKSEKREFKNLASSPKLHGVVRAIAGLQQQRIFEVCDTLFLPVAERRLAKLKQNGKAGK